MAHSNIDAVYLWVDGADPQFRKSLLESKNNFSPDGPEESSLPSRFRDNGELRYSLRSIERFAPWVRKIHIVTNGQIPWWLNTEHPKINLINHDAIFQDAKCLPSFNSHAIELQLHRIPNLSRHFLYFNDDTFLGNSVFQSDFINIEGGQNYFFDDISLLLGNSTVSVHDKAYQYTLNLIEQHWGKVKYPFLPAHSPQIYDREILETLSNLFDNEHRLTSSHPFRSETDLVMRLFYNAFLFQIHPENGKQIPIFFDWHSKDNFFFMLSRRYRDEIRKFIRIYRLKPRFFAINDDEEIPSRLHPTLLALRLFLAIYFPKRSSFEKQSCSRSKKDSSDLTNTITRQ